MPNPGAVIDALVAVLDADATFRALIADGVWKDVTPSGITTGAVVSLTIHQDDYVQGGTAFEVFTVLIKAVHRSQDPATVVAAAARIQALVHDVALVATGYDYMRSQRIEHVSYTEIDENSDERWQHCGGRYEIWMSPQAA